jgi:membrane protease YdiL (CAAX protease family)
VAGVRFGPGLLLTSAIFAAGHLLTELNPGRLAVFFPSLLFGLLRARTGGIGASLLFHAMCNVLSWYLLHGYGLVR